MTQEKQNQAVLAVAWYRAEEWQRLKESAADPEVFEDSHAEWLALTESLVRDLQSKGVTAEPVDIAVDELLDWCARKNRPVDASARADYSAVRLRDRHMNETK